ncbi:MAG TPA: carboxylesterase/lipase family protein [Ktedonobacteraceae bacterium]|nr:carboxylesterase/lipase family protein [Ktedonobacteraceae bacterium]
MSNDAIVETRYGKVRGTNSGSVSCWKGIPYAQAPIGKLRFHPPQLPQPWSGTRDATVFGSIAPQNVVALSNLARTLDMGTGGTQEPISEDCLYLNIWSPQADDQKRPVMVWIHGGAFTLGSGSQPDYNGAHFAQEGDLVVVTLNYRLGVLGFLHLAELGNEEYSSSGNAGLLDQIAALQWVRENIEAFGGDPDNITVFGESAGAMSVGSLLVMPAARGLFQRAILQSGAAHSIQNKEAASKLAREFLEILDLRTDNLTALTAIPLETLLDAQATLLLKNPLGGIRPVVDGKDIPELPIQALTQGGAKEVAILIGTNRDEIKLFTAGTSESSLDANVAQQMLGDKAIEIFTTYAANRPGADMRAIGLDISTDYTFRIPAIRLAESQAQQGVNVWMYRFDWPSPNAIFGACHALELPFVWNNLETTVFRGLTGANPPLELARRMHGSWIAFARTGNPNISDLPPWPTYDTDKRTTMLFNEECSVFDDPQGAERAAWEGLL